MFFWEGESAAPFACAEQSDNQKTIREKNFSTGGRKKSHRLIDRGAGNISVTK
jgi:hypothetical protein